MFKIKCRRIANFCIKEGQEHHLATSYGHVIRLRKMGIVNKLPAILGMPILDEEDSITVTQAILAMRGVNQKKDKERHLEGTLKIANRTCPVDERGNVQKALKEASVST